MKIKRFAALILAIGCLVLAGTVLHNFHVPIVAPVKAQEDNGVDGMGIGFGPHLVPARAQDRKEAYAVILGQLTAFRQNDYRKAVQFQGRQLQQNFRSVANFRNMIVSAYPEFAHFKAVKFEDARSDPRGREILVVISLTGQDNVTVHAAYRLARENGIYRVESVMGGMGGNQIPLLKMPKANDVV